MRLRGHPGLRVWRLWSIQRRWAMRCHKSSSLGLVTLHLNNTVALLLSLLVLLLLRRRL
jgi:hypothetical protein